MATLISSLAAVLTAVMALPNPPLRGPFPAHMLSGLRAYQMLRRARATTFDNTDHLLKWTQESMEANRSKDCLDLFHLEPPLD